MAPSHRPPQGVEDDRLGIVGHGAHGVHGAEDLGDGRAVVVQLEHHLLADGNQLVATPVEPHDVGLEAVAEPRLGEAAVALQVVDQTQEVDQQVVVDGLGVGGDQPAEEHPAGAGRRLGRQPVDTQGDAPGRDHGARVPYLELGQEHW